MGNTHPLPVDPIRFRALYEEVWNQVYRLDTTWTIYHCVYGAQHSLETISATAPITFGGLQVVMNEAIVIGTHRLREAGSSEAKRTASIQTLVSWLPPELTILRRQLRKDIRRVRADCRELGEWRDRHFAHRDLATALRDHPLPLEPLPMRSVGNAIEVCVETLNAISDALRLELPYDRRRETADLDVHELIRRLDAARHL